ncbi:hypothetical protein HKBW3S25_01415, partial [Candidatus Hakubella thermalkaliphila]
GRPGSYYDQVGGLESGSLLIELNITGRKAGQITFTVVKLFDLFESLCQKLLERG